MSIGKKLKILNYVLVGAVILLVLFVYLAGSNQVSLNNSYDTRYESYRRAIELRQSSDDLTRLARTYVITQDDKYENMYWDILAVRNGKKAREDGSKISLEDIMKDLGFTDKEFGKLKEAAANSNSLVTTETIAMNEVKGLYADDQGGYTVRKEPDFKHAAKIMFDNKYHADKQIIVDPINEFDKMLNERTKTTALKFKQRGNIYLAVVGLLSIVLGALILLTNRNVKQVLEGIVSELDHSIDLSTKVANEINTSSTAMASATSEQAAAAQETSATLNEISAMVSRNLDSAKTSNEKAEASHNVAKQGQQAVEDVLHSINDVEQSNKSIMEDVLDSNKEISKIVEMIKGIADKTKVINDIVFQTKLLSFNASVEAARAGEQGKGFSVVAEEVGALAQMSGKAAAEISEMLEVSIVDVESIVEKTRDNIDRLESNSKTKLSASVEKAKICEDSLSRVVDNVNEVKNMMEHITKASEEQVEGVSNINIAMTQIESGTQVTSRSAHEVETSSQKLFKEFKNVEKLVVSLKNEILGVTQTNRVKVSKATSPKMENHIKKIEVKKNTPTTEVKHRAEKNVLEFRDSDFEDVG